MNNVIQLAQPPKIEPIENIEDLNAARNLKSAMPKPDPNIFFPVEQVPLSALTGMEDRDLQAIVRTDTRQIIAVHGVRYKLVKNEEVFKPFDDLVRSTKNLDTNGMRIVDQTSYIGGRTIRSYIFPEHRIQIGRGRSKDKVEMRLNVINSYDGSTNMRFNLGGFRIVCANGMVIGDEVANYTSRHTSGFSVMELKHRIAASLDNFLQVGEQWRLWARTPCTDKKALAVMTKIAGKSEKLLADLMMFWDLEKAKLGDTMWALFNAMTYWSTHYGIRPHASDNASAVVLDREARIQRILKSDEFKAAA